MDIIKKIIILIIVLSGCSDNSGTIKLVFAGDVMLDRGINTVIEEKGMNFLFENVSEIISSSDISVVNFESTAFDDTLLAVNKKFTFNSNPKWLSALYGLGINYVTLANNHSMDFNEEGIRQTALNLEKSGIEYIGYNSNERHCKPAIIESRGNNIIIFSSSFLIQEHSYVCCDSAFILAEKIRLLKMNYPACIVFICIHWGVELKEAPTFQQIEQAHILIDAGADVIIGHHPHVVQSIELYKNKYIFYSLGNFIFDNNTHPSNKSIFVEIFISENKIMDLRIIPFKIIKSKPEFMKTNESNIFMKKIDSISPTLILKQKNSGWKISRY